MSKFNEYLEMVGKSSRIGSVANSLTNEYGKGLSDSVMKELRLVKQHLKTNGVNTNFTKILQHAFPNEDIDAYEIRSDIFDFSGLLDDFGISEKQLIAKIKKAKDKMANAAAERDASFPRAKNADSYLQGPRDI